jgi:hypothetical protein
VPLPIPVLDDRRFDDLVSEARALIPMLAPAWTNHNASDPGITVVELLAYLVETLIYRLDRVTPELICAFLNLLDSGATRTPVSAGSRTVLLWTGPRAGTTADLSAEIRNTILYLRKLDRAVSCQDFEVLAMDRAALKASRKAGVARAKCIPRRNLAPGADPRQELPDHVSVILLAGDEDVTPLADLIDDVGAYLDDRRLIGTLVHVVGPQYAQVGVQVSVMPRADQADFAAVQQAVVGAVTTFLDPLAGGADRRGWPFGRGVFVSELFALISRLPQISYVDTVTLIADSNHELQYASDGNDDKPVIGITIEPHELVHLDMKPADVTSVKKDTSA